MYHHDMREYDSAVNEAGKRFQVKLEEQIHQSRQSAISVLEKIQSEVPHDRVVHSKELEFSLDENRTVLLGTRDRRKNGHFQEAMHKHALAQVAERAGIPETYLNRLMAREYGPQLVVENLSTIYQKEPPKKYLVRSVGDEVRGVLSDSYRRMDSRPIIEAFAEVCESIGAVPVEGIGGDLRWAIKAILPMVFQPSQKQGSEEFIAFGAQLSNSDFGVGALSLRLFYLRVWCTNFATMEEALRQVHLGKRLDENIEYSEKTYQLDTQTQVSAVRDIVRGVLAPARINGTVARIGVALEERIDPRQAWQDLPKMGLLKGEVDKVKEIFVNGGVEELPAGTTLARLSNAISWFAKSAPTPERRLELEQVAGAVMMKAPAAA